MNIKTAVMRKGEMKFDTMAYMNDFPFEYYLVVKDVKDLSGILGEVLRQYFEQRWKWLIICLYDFIKFNSNINNNKIILILLYKY